MSDEKFTLFWGGPFSQWTEAMMTIDGVVYNCCEQYMMAMKARCFGDAAAEKAIMNTRDPREQKRLGRGVKGFVKSQWEALQENGKPYCWNVVYKANEAKFSQNPGFKEVLLESKGTTVVEASPYDEIWGIALGEDDPRAKDRSKWRGTNWLGEVLTQLREDFIAAEN